MDINTRIVVIGASAGGIPAIGRLLSGLSPDWNAVVVVVQHLSPHSNASIIVRTWQQQTAMACRTAEDGLIIERGAVYLAPSNHHLMLSGGNLRVYQGPRQNNYRPSIDVLFRSAAVEWRNRYRDYPYLLIG
jgi:two-component system chemotaxis response regulator CheB